jgi:hypothetical protein
MIDDPQKQNYITFKKFSEMYKEKGTLGTNTVRVPIRMDTDI